MAAPFIRTQYNLDAQANSDATGLRCLDKTLAQQQFKEDTDINVLFGRYLETGEFPQVETAMSYGNFEGVFDFQTAMNTVRAAQEAFGQLPARIKNRFDNDPQKLVEFINDPENREEAEFLKLVDKPKAEPAPTPVIPTGSTGSAEPAPSATAPVSNPTGRKVTTP